MNCPAHVITSDRRTELLTLKLLSAYPLGTLLLMETSGVFASFLKKNTTTLPWLFLAVPLGHGISHSGSNTGLRLVYTKQTRLGFETTLCLGKPAQPHSSE